MDKQKLVKHLDSNYEYIDKDMLLAMEKRVEEINTLLDSFVELDDDICDNLIAELDEIEAKCLKSIKATRIKELGLRIV